MQEISIKKILIAVLIVIALSQIRKIAAFLKAVYQTFYDVFEPVRGWSPEWKYVNALMFLALIYVTIFKLILNRK